MSYIYSNCIPESSSFETLPNLFLFIRFPNSSFHSLLYEQVQFLLFSNPTLYCFIANKKSKYIIKYSYIYMSSFNNPKQQNYFRINNRTVDKYLFPDHILESYRNSQRKEEKALNSYKKKKLTKEYIDNLMTLLENKVTKYTDKRKNLSQLVYDFNTKNEFYLTINKQLNQGKEKETNKNEPLPHPKLSLKPLKKLRKIKKNILAINDFKKIDFEKNWKDWGEIVPEFKYKEEADRNTTANKKYYDWREVTDNDNTEFNDKYKEKQLFKMLMKNSSRESSSVSNNTMNFHMKSSRNPSISRNNQLLGVDSSSWSMKGLFDLRLKNEIEKDFGFISSAKEVMVQTKFIRKTKEMSDRNKNSSLSQSQGRLSCFGDNYICWRPSAYRVKQSILCENNNNNKNKNNNHKQKQKHMSFHLDKDLLKWKDTVEYAGQDERKKQKVKLNKEKIKEKEDQEWGKTEILKKYENDVQEVEKLVWNCRVNRKRSSVMLEKSKTKSTKNLSSLAKRDSLRKINTIK